MAALLPGREKSPWPARRPGAAWGGAAAGLPQRSENRCGVGGISRDSTGFVAMEEGLISSGGRNLRLPLQF